MIFLSGCSPKYDYAVHKPKIIYKKPSKKALKKTLKENLGKKYVWAEEGPKAFDCSGLTYYSYGRMNMEIPRVSREQAKVGKSVEISDLQYGDLIFFDTTKQRTGKITHVGVYIGEGRFQHAANKDKGVIVTDLNSPYYNPRIITCKRYLPDDTNGVTTAGSYMLASNKTKPTITPLTTEHKETSNNIYKGNHYIQVGTFSNQPAEGLFQQIRSNGYRYRVIQIASMRKVLIGPYHTRTEAQRYLDEVRATILPDAFTVKI